MSTVPPVRREVLVTAGLSTAFELFTAHVGAWWPLVGHSVFGERASVAFEGDRLVERRGTEHAVWGEVLEWEPPHRLRMTWHPGYEHGPATEVAVDFAERGEQVLVTLVHTGWERLDDPQAAADEYASGWVGVLDRYRAAVDRDDASATDDLDVPDGERWFALLHRPGPALGDGGSVFAHPLFGEHAAFLDRLEHSGRLVAAGPLPDENGAGMAVLRLPAGDDVDVEHLANTDDQSVVGGLLTVQVRPWRVLVSS